MVLIIISVILSILVYGPFADCWNAVDLAIVLDMSGSTENSHDLELRLARLLVDRLDVRRSTYSGGSQVAFMTFAASTAAWFTLNTYNNKTELLEAFNIIHPAEEGTNTQDALFRMQADVFNPTAGDRSGVPNVAVIVTDGRSNIQQDRTMQAAAAARNAGTSIYVIGVGDVNEAELLGLSGSNNYRVVGNDQQAVDTIDFIARKLCTP